MERLRRRAAAGRKCIVPGVIDSTTNFIEHLLVAQRIVRYADLVGREHVIVDVDCGFATFAGAPTVLPAIAWAKLGALRRAPASPLRSCGHACMKAASA